MGPKVKIIVAMSPTKVIGKMGQIPWFYPGDLKFFRDQTSGHTVVMGRKTWDSLPENVRPLPNRINYVLSRTLTTVGEGVKDTFVKPSLQEALAHSADTFPRNTIWVIGGSEIYKEALDGDWVDEIIITHVPTNVPPADDLVYFPTLSADWELRMWGLHPYEEDLRVSYWELAESY